MTDTLTVLNNIRQVHGKLLECKEQILNKQKKSEIERLIQELKLLEDSLLVKSPFMASVTSTSTPSLSSFRVFADNNNLSSPEDISRAASQQFSGNMIEKAKQDAIQRQVEKDRAKSEIQADYLLPQIRERLRLAGRSLTNRDLQVEIHRFVAAQSAIENSQVDTVSRLIFERILRDEGRLG